MIRLGHLQRRFHDAITGRVPLATACDLVRDDGVPPLDRLQVYAHAYFVRIRDALAAEYPKLAAVLGADDFTTLVARYLDAYPTRHPSLRDAGLRLPGFLSADEGARAGARWHGDLARLERARTEVFDGPDAVPLRRSDLAALAPEDFPGLRLRLVPSSALVPIETNADDVWSAIEDDATLPFRTTASRTVLVWRRAPAVVHRTVGADEGQLLPALRHGASFAELCAGLVGRPDAVDRALALVLTWIDAEVLAHPSELGAR
jgi:hypothetical protein